jgi:hypothetical protein
MMLLMSLAFKDRLARFLEYSAAIALVGYGSSAALGISLGIGPVPTSVAATYPAFAIAAALAIGRLLGNRLHYALAAITVACWGFGRGGSVYERVHRTLPGLPYLIAAAAAFAFALLISLVKAGNARRLPSVQDPQGGPDDRGDAAFEAPCRRVGQWGYLALVGLYRMFSLAGIVLIAVGFPPGPLWEMWLPHDVALFVSHHCVEVAVLATLVALALGLCIGVVRLAFAMRPSRSLRWYFIANVLVLAGVLFTLPAVH